VNDDIVEEIRRIREELINRHGGIEGYFRHCQAQERAATARRKPRHANGTGRTARKTSKAR
jgi:hypothetical protein